MGISHENSWKLHQTYQVPMSYKRIQYLSMRLQALYIRYYKIRFSMRRLRGRHQLRHLNQYFGDVQALLEESHLEWLDIAHKQARDIIEKYNVSIILTSSSPFITHIIGHLLKRELGLKWVADFRDLWSQNDTLIEYSPISMALERKVLRRADACLVPTEGLLEMQRNVFQGNIFVIRNAYSTRLHAPKSSLGESPLRIIYTGNIYYGFQDLGQILKVLSKLNSNHIKYVLEIYGFGKFYAKKICKTIFGSIPPFVHLFDEVSRTVSHRIQQEADLLLILDWSFEIGNEFTKFSEYLSSGTFIVATGNQSDSTLRRAIRITNSGLYFEDENFLLEFLESTYESRSIVFKSNLEEVEKYGAAYQVSKLNKYLRQISSD